MGWYGNSQEKFIKKDPGIVRRGFSKTKDFLNKHNFKFAGSIPGVIGEIVGTTVGMNYRLSQGEKFLPALGKELIENSVWGIAFGPMLAYTVGNTLIDVAPDVINAANQSTQFAHNYRYLGGSYIDTQTNYINRARGVEQIKRARLGIRNAMGSEARRYHQTY